MLVVPISLPFENAKLETILETVTCVKITISTFQHYQRHLFFAATAIARFTNFTVLVARVLYGTYPYQVEKPLSPINPSAIFVMAVLISQRQQIHPIGIIQIVHSLCHMNVTSC